MFSVVAGLIAVVFFMVFSVYNAVYLYMPILNQKYQYKTFLHLFCVRNFSLFSNHSILQQ